MIFVAQLGYLFVMDSGDLVLSALWTRSFTWVITHIHLPIKTSLHRRYCLSIKGKSQVMKMALTIIMCITSFIS